MESAPYVHRPVQVSTLLVVREQNGVDAASEGVFRARHRDQVAQARKDLKSGRTKALLVSVDYCRDHLFSDVSKLIREVPRIPTIAILSTYEPQGIATLLSLGKAGVGTVVDLGADSGWDDLRNALVEGCADRVETRIIRSLQRIVSQPNRECLEFFREMAWVSRRTASVRQLADRFGVLPSTLMSRFFRAKLPAPKRYLTHIRLIRAAALFENHGLSIANVSNHLDYSSPQSFGRHVQCVTGLTALEFRKTQDLQLLTRRFEQEYLEPYRDRLRIFRPITAIV
jgi:AraC-like DNA-binding protein